MAAWHMRHRLEFVDRVTASSVTQAIELENVVRGAHERPFALDLVESPQQELPKSPRVFDLPDHRFDHRLPSGIDGGAVFRVQLARHPVDHTRRRRQRATRTRPRPLAMFLLARRDVRINRRVGDRRHIHVRAIAFRGAAR